MTLFAIGGVPLQLHPTFLWFVGAWGAWATYTEGLPGALSTVVVVLAVFGSVLAHELGHVGVARRLGLGVRAIVLLPIGGAARIEMPRDRPLADAVVSVAGPLVSLLLGGASLGLYALLSWQGLYLFGLWNLAIGLFNLLPAFPMDGGRVLRAVLAAPIGMRRANLVTLAIGAAFTLGLFAFGIRNAQLGFVLFGVLMGLMQWQEARLQLRLDQLG